MGREKSLQVSFTQPESWGWIDLEIEVKGEGKVQVPISFLDDPFRSIMNFLRGILNPEDFPVLPNWGVYEEAPEMLFKQEPSPDGNPRLFRLIVHDDIEDVEPSKIYLDVILDRYGFVKEFAGKLLRFIETDYDAKRWTMGREDITDLYQLKPQLLELLSKCS